MSKILNTTYQTHHKTPLPIINWQNIGEQAPLKIALTDKNTLPAADMAIITWTAAEWSALDHVFINSDQPRDASATSWQAPWREHAIYHDDQLLMYFQMVKITTENNTTKNVLLVKSEVHLAHYPFIIGVSEMVQAIIDQSGAKQIISTGTAGGSGVSQTLGDVVLTNAAHIHIKQPINVDHCDYNNQTIISAGVFKQTDLLNTVRANLMMPLDTIWNDALITDSLAEINQRCKTHYSYQDLVNPPLTPSNLTQVQTQIAGDKPLLTTDYYYIAEPNDGNLYCFLEMDDAVIAKVCKDAGVVSGFIRNVSDPIVATEDQKGNPIPSSVRDDWSGLIYSSCGLYTTFNSALTSWSVVRSTALSS